MSKTVYLLGAGVNRDLTNEKGLKPPLDGDFFRLLAQRGEALQGEAVPKGSRVEPYKLCSTGPVPQFDEASEPGTIHWVYGFIQRFWHLSPRDLAEVPFSLEELLTLLQLKQRDAQRSNNNPEAKEWLFCELVLENRFLNYLHSFSGMARADRDMAELGRVFYRDKATVITTNYDAFVEEVIHQASEEDSKADGNQAAPTWNKRDAYCVKFTEPGSTTTSPKPTPPLVLKLHGSLNWLTLINEAGSLKAEDILFYIEREAHTYDGLSERSLRGPLIVPPMLYKDAYYDHQAIRSVWEEAQKQMSDCERLVVIGYSFPPTDFHIKKLLIDALSDRDLRELVVVNPDTSVVHRIKRMAHFQKPVSACDSLGEFLRSG